MGDYGTALIAACATGPVKVVEVILSDSDVDVSAVSSTGQYRTALIAACAKDRVDVAKQLLKAGARILPGPRQPRETNALHRAVKTSSVALVRQLWKRLPDLNQYQGGNKCYRSG